MHHISANLEFSRRKNKIFGVQKASVAAKTLLGGDKNSVDLFFFFFFFSFFLDTKVLMGVAKKSAGGAVWQVTPQDMRVLYMETE